ncbi:MAG: asparagine synthetase B [Candidatus Diapherotrites archaeon]|nr:asparagine synthetase B [Candidatus Diapherotrites archaeon]
MASVSFIYSKKNPVKMHLIDFLYSQKHRGLDFFELNGKEKINSNNLKGLNEKDFSCSEGIAFNCFKNEFEENSFLIKKGIYLTGKIFNSEALNKLEKIDFNNLIELNEFVSIARGEYAVAFNSGNKFFFFNDFLGAKPLWFGETSNFFAVASEPRALRKLDISFPLMLPAGHLLEFSEGKFELKKLFNFEDLKKIKSKTSFPELVSSFNDSIELRTKGVSKAGIFFSGGIDSSLIAKAVSDKVKKTVLFSVGIKGSQDLIYAKKSAKEMNLDLELIEVKEKDLKLKVIETLKALYFFDEMQLQIGLPEFILAENVSDKGFKTIFNGQGSDELFCGYSEFKSALQNKGYLGVQEQIYYFLDVMHARNFYREEMISSKFNLNFNAPLLDLEFVKKAVAFSAEKKIYSISDELRKHPIRELGKEFGVSKTAIERKKKAIQYGTGLNKYRKLI